MASPTRRCASKGFRPILLAAHYRTRGVSVPEVFQMLLAASERLYVCYAVCGPRPKLNRLPEWESNNNGHGSVCVCSSSNEGDGRVRVASAPSPAHAQAVGAVTCIAAVTSVWRSGLRGCGCLTPSAIVGTAVVPRHRKAAAHHLVALMRLRFRRARPTGGASPRPFLTCRVVRACSVRAGAPRSRKSKNGGRT